MGIKLIKLQSCGLKDKYGYLREEMNFWLGSLVVILKMKLFLDFYSS